MWLLLLLEIPILGAGIFSLGYIGGLWVARYRDLRGANGVALAAAFQKTMAVTLIMSVLLTGWLLMPPHDMLHDVFGKQLRHLRAVAPALGMLWASTALTALLTAGTQLEAWRRWSPPTSPTPPIDPGVRH